MGMSAAIHLVINNVLSDKKYVRVLLADDDPADRKRFQIALRLANPDVKIEALVNGIQLIEHLTNPQSHLQVPAGKPDLIITDLYMPFAGGLQVLKQIRRSTTFKDIPIYVFSANNDRIIRSKMQEFGATEFYKKTTDGNELQHIINGIMSKFSAPAAA
jgi:DNA-binding NarL/FixJ family response regulator